jgi:hypothetical protein
VIFTADERLPSMMLDQPSETSKSARNLASYYRANGGPFEMTIRAYLQDGRNATRLFAPETSAPSLPTPYRSDADDGGYQGSIPLESPRGLALLKLFERED